MAPFLLVKFSNWGKAFSLSNNCANIDTQYVELKTPAHPHALSLSLVRWGAVSVPKKKFSVVASCGLKKSFSMNFPF